MTVFDGFKSKNIDELAEWFDKHSNGDDSWIRWFDKKYCRNCECIPIDESMPWRECAYCEVHNKCRFFPEMEEAPSCKQIAKLWLESEAEDDN